MRLLLIFICTSFLLIHVFANIQTTGWMNDKAFETNVFIENAGQYNADQLDTEAILYGTKQQGAEIFFTSTGIIYRFSVINPEKQDTYLDLMEEEKNEKVKLEANWEKLSPEERALEVLKEKEIEIALKNMSIHDVTTFQIKWENFNEGVTVVSEGLNQASYNFINNTELNPVTTNNYQRGTINAKAYNKLIYRNIYPNVDVEYFIHDEGGLKYNIVVHPGGDPSQIVMEYIGVDDISEDNGNILIEKSGNFIKDANPVSYQGENQRDIVESNSILENNKVSFNINHYDDSKDLIIDPWLTVTNFSGASIVRHVVTDNAGNIYAYGGGGSRPAEIRKYTPAGTLEWVFETMEVDWFGNLEINKENGDLYLGTGLTRVYKISSDGNLIWLNDSFGFIFADEPWSISLNCSKDKLMIGGMLSPVYLDLSTGEKIDTLPPGDFAGGTDEIRTSITGPKGGFILLKLETVFFLCHDLTIYNLFLHGLGFQYYGPAYDPDPNPGTNNFLAADTNFVYAHNGDILKKWDFLLGNFVDEVEIPGGEFEGGSGTLVDECGNVYVGSNLGVFKFNQNLEMIDSASIGPVFDLAFGSGGEIIATGDGYIASVNLNHCNKFAYCEDDSCSRDIKNAYICKGDSAKLNAYDGGASYSWTPTAGLSDPTIAHPMASPDVTTTYVATITCPGFCGYTDSFTVSVIDLIADPEEATICAGDTITLNVTGAEDLVWTPSNSLSSNTGSTVDAYPITQTQYTIVSEEDTTCPVTVNVSVNETPEALFNFILDSCIAYRVLFSSDVAGIVSCEWVFGDNTTSDECFPNKIYDAPGNYIVILSVIDDNGCQSSIEQMIVVDNANETCIAVPDVFSPNGDGLNDVFKPAVFNVAEVTYFKIYNRWGTLIFESNNVNDGWDGTYHGKEQGIGVYLYQLSGRTNSGKELSINGNVVLVK